ncbi:HAMP domain-containing sensor histidine kinase [Leminorella grimontii]|uniref:HAMP domain-containing sensor histidine kinase n=1 Tax=Leminorella grimontii TaxID=82981 RepID=UPI0020881796|nr:HAMP domain-containing sensor histidine kinase [Leminorella grimontii]GKX58606.1 two-component sensor histidine kinase [Leminorella grimontii]
MKKFSRFPRSLRQLVLLAFLLVLLPLLVLAWQAYKSLDLLSEQAADINSTTLRDARRSEAMTNLALSMERSYRQYCVLGDETLEKLYQEQRQQYASMMDVHAAVLPNEELYKSLKKLLNDLGKIQCKNSGPDDASSALLIQFSKTSNEMVQTTRGIIFSRGEKLQQAIADKGYFFGQQALLLFLLSVLLVFLFTRMIIGPVKQVERMINRLGEGKSLTSLAAFKGPREIQSLAQRIVWLSERLSWLESQRHEFLRHISHELKTPLASMREGTELLLDQVAGPLTEDQKDVVAILDNSSRDLQRLIEQLLDYNRYQADARTEKSHIDLELMASEVIAAHSLPARAKLMTTECRLAQSECWAESPLLKRVLDNLYSNAVHYGEESGTIWIVSQRVGQMIQIDVANTGEKILPQEKAMLFEPFYQGSRQRKGAVKGSGLGLSIARDCIRQMEGELHLVDVDYADVCFRIELPLSIEK